MQGGRPPRPLFAARPSHHISPNFREAPTLIPSPDGKAWYLYYEQYPGVSYGLSVASSLDGPWFKSAATRSTKTGRNTPCPFKVRHGAMLPIRREEYEAPMRAFERK